MGEGCSGSNSTSLHLEHVMKMLILIVAMLVPAFAFAEDEAIFYIRLHTSCTKLVADKSVRRDTADYRMQRRCKKALECDEKCSWAFDSSLGGDFSKFPECRKGCFQ